jgi:hypothetical protein
MIAIFWKTERRPDHGYQDRILNWQSFCRLRICSRRLRPGILVQLTQGPVSMITEKKKKKTIKYAFLIQFTDMKRRIMNWHCCHLRKRWKHWKPQQQRSKNLDKMSLVSFRLVSIIDFRPNLKQEVELPPAPTNATGIHSKLLGKKFV